MKSRIVALPARFAPHVAQVVDALKLSVECHEACEEIGVAGPDGYLGAQAVDSSRTGTIYVLVIHEADVAASTPLAALASPEIPQSSRSTVPQRQTA